MDCAMYLELNILLSNMYILKVCGSIGRDDINGLCRLKNFWKTRIR